jgi:hypothetical protein
VTGNTRAAFRAQCHGFDGHSAQAGDRRTRELRSRGEIAADKFFEETGADEGIGTLDPDPGNVDDTGIKELRPMGFVADSRTSPDFPWNKSGTFH